MDAPLTLEELEARWKPPGKSPAARRRWLMQQMHRLDLRSFIPGRGRSLRFRPADVLRAEARGCNGQP